MKVTHLHDSQYLAYFLRRNKLHIDDYETFLDNIKNTLNEKDTIYINKVHQNMHIDLRPYLFTMNFIPLKMLTSFLMFSNHYFKKSGYDNIVFHHTQHDNVLFFLQTVQHSNLMLLSMLHIMQYYFL